MKETKTTMAMVDDITSLRNDLKNKVGLSLHIKEQIGKDKYVEYDGTLLAVNTNILIFDIKSKGMKKTIRLTDVLIKKIILS